ncbi:MAG TPA: TetR/AcrR family transcriptional regulator [Actinomycetota bacterium]|nr:TetR/AcrR family transcriptional regulator [Actinomycetota bacterium]
MALGREAAKAVARKAAPAGRAVQKPAAAAEPARRLTKGERTRARLVAAAEQVFEQGSYDEASIVEITRQAGVSQGTFYLYFPSKLEIFREVVRDLSHQLRSHIAQTVEGAATRAEVERQGFEAFFAFVQQHPGLYRIIRQAEFVDRDIYRYHYERLAEGYTRGLRAAVKAGEFRDVDVEVLAYALMGMGELIGARWLLWEDEPGGKVPAKVVDALVGIVLEGVKKPN